MCSSFWKALRSNTLSKKSSYLTDEESPYIRAWPSWTKIVLPNLYSGLLTHKIGAAPVNVSSWGRVEGQGWNATRLTRAEVLFTSSNNETDRVGIPVSSMGDNQLLLVSESLCFGLQHDSHACVSILLLLIIITIIIITLIRAIPQ